MGRAKVPMKLIECSKSRNNTFMKRRKGLKKKAFEFSTLCGVDVCLLCFGPNGDRDHKPETWPEDDLEVERIIKRYEDMSKGEQEKRKLNLSGFLEEKRKKLEDKLNPKQKEKAYGYCNDSFDVGLNDLSEKSLRELLVMLDSKIDDVKSRIEFLSMNPYQINGVSDNYQKDLMVLNDVPLSFSYTDVAAGNYRDFNNGGGSFQLPLLNGSYYNYGDGMFESNEISAYSMFQYQQAFYDVGCLPQMHGFLPSLMGSSSLNPMPLQTILPQQQQMHGFLPQTHQHHHLNHNLEDFQDCMIARKKESF